jgi:low affinity Fe/Cu permease
MTNVRGDTTRPADAPMRPSDVSPRRSRFDAIADVVVGFTSRGRFLLIVTCCLVAWLGAGFIVGFDSTWLNAGGAGIGWVTLMLLFTVENAQRRSDQAVQRKLNAIADALADFMAAEDVPAKHVEELRSAVGLEERESTD